MQNKIETERLILRPINEKDLVDIAELINNKKISDVTRLIPHPYVIDDAKEWYKKQKDECQNNAAAIFAITLKDSDKMIGAIGLQINQNDENAELGYWLGEPYWDVGYMTEAAKAVLDFGFKKLKLHRIFAHHMKINDASGKVLQKIGMRYEGSSKEHIKKNGIFQDLENYGIFADSGT